MRKAVKVTNKFLSTIGAFSSINSSDESGSFTITDTSVDGYSLPGSTAWDLEWQKGIYFLLVDYGTIAEEWFRIYRTDLTNKVVYFDKRGGPNGKQIHYANASIQINDVAEAVNMLSENIDNFGFVEYVNGSSPKAVKVYWGYPLYNLVGFTSVSNVADTQLAIGTWLTDNADNYIVFDFNSGAFSSKTAADLSGQTFYGSVVAKVVCAGGNISSVTDYRGYSMGLAVNKDVFQFTSGALTLKDNAVNISKIASSGASNGQYLMFNGSAWVPSGGMAPSTSALKTTWADVVVSSSAPPTAGQVLKATSATNAVWSDVTVDINALSGATVDFNADSILWYDASAGANKKFSPIDLAQAHIETYTTAENINAGDVVRKWLWVTSYVETSYIWSYTTSTNVATSTSNRKFGSTFSLEKDWIREIKIYMYKQWSPIGNLTCKVYSDLGTTLLATSNTITASSLSTDFTNWFLIFTFNANAVQAGSLYLTIETDQPDNAVNYPVISLQSNNWHTAYNITSWNVWNAVWGWYDMRYQVTSWFNEDNTKIYKASASGQAACNTVLWVAYTTSISWNPCHVVSRWVVNNLSWLTAGSVYYITNTGTISTTPGTKRKKIGTAISTTQLAVYRENMTVLTFVKDTSNASTTTTYIHSLWVVPSRIITRTITNQAGSSQSSYSHWAWFSGWQNCAFGGNNLTSVTWSTSSSYSLIWIQANTSYQTWVIQNVTATTFDIVWTLTWTQTWIMAVICEIYE